LPRAAPPRGPIIAAQAGGRMHTHTLRPWMLPFHIIYTFNCLFILLYYR